MALWNVAAAAAAHGPTLGPRGKARSMIHATAASAEPAFCRTCRVLNTSKAVDLLPVMASVMSSAGEREANLVFNELLAQRVHVLVVKSHSR
mmetsp:Transcript_93831/g.202878  ORF Transcript_93831/g.202878 Transcript_93831/m.202878 type:complete len:92 (+) Transcript_93831:261-536(+)